MPCQFTIKYCSPELYHWSCFQATKFLWEDQSIPMVLVITSSMLKPTCKSLAPNSPLNSRSYISGCPLGIFSTYVLLSLLKSIRSLLVSFLCRECILHARQKANWIFGSQRADYGTLIMLLISVSRLSGSMVELYPCFFEIRCVIWLFGPWNTLMVMCVTFRQKPLKLAHT